MFVGGGTPTQLPSALDLVRVLRAIDATFGLAADAEVTTEANPDSVHARLAGRAARWGFQPHLCSASGIARNNGNAAGGF